MVNTSKKRRKRGIKDIIPLEQVFRPDPYGDQEDTRPVEVRKGRRGRPVRVIPWEVIKHG